MLLCCAFKTQYFPLSSPRIFDRLGGGEFGDVVRGYWKSADYSVEVAVKTLSNQHGPDERLKLLQEAAIMSQFRHPNVVKLYGVVCNEQQVHRLIYAHPLFLELVLFFSLLNQFMLVLELLKKGDLRHVLLTMKPE